MSEDIVDIGDLFTSRKRRREGAGWSEHSWIKHDMAAKPVLGQAAAFRARFPDARILLIDANAGDGVGVEKRRPDLFDPTVVSRPSSQLMCELAERIGNATVVLCERDHNKRVALWHRYGAIATIVADHREIPCVVRPEHRYALWLSDPNGPSGHGIPHMRAVADRVLCDFVVIFNEGAVNRMRGTQGDKWETSRARYGHMKDPQWWLEALNKQAMSRTRKIPQSQGFHFRVLVIANWFADAARRHPFIEVINRENLTKQEQAHA